MCINVCSNKIKQNLNMSKLATAFDSGLSQQVPGKSASTTAPHVQVAAVKISVNKEPRQRRFTQMPTSIYKQNTTDRPQGPLDASDNVSSNVFAGTIYFIVHGHLLYERIIFHDI